MSVRRLEDWDRRRRLDDLGAEYDSSLFGEAWHGRLLEDLAAGLSPQQREQLDQVREELMRAAREGRDRFQN